jgi:flagellar biosynthesis/type III secretory pathway protein FliH
VQVPQHLNLPLQEKIDVITSRGNFDGQVLLVVNNELAEGDCRIIWDAGEIERSMSTTWCQIDKIIDRIIVETEAPPTKDVALGDKNNEA